MRKLTMFSWGYWGWGNAVPEFLRASAAVERERGFKPPMFVDIRLRRGGRAPGFHGVALEKALGGARYVWMPSLGNKSVDTGDEEIVIKDPDDVERLLDLALDASKAGRRVIFFCACQVENDCHRKVVSRLLLRAASRRHVATTVVEWPGGLPGRRPLASFRFAPKVWDRLSDGGTIMPLPASVGRGVASSWPWGTLVRVTDGGREFVAPVGPARFISGRWAAPLLPVFNKDVGVLVRKIAALRREWRVEPRQSK
jgi:Protein of unknown function, DUF488